MKRGTRGRNTQANLPGFDLPEALSPAQAEKKTRVAVASRPQAAVLADEIQNALEEASEFRTMRIEFRSEPGTEAFGRSAGTTSDPHVVVLALEGGAPDEVQLSLAWIQDRFPHRPVLVAPLNSEEFDACLALEMGASDFLLPPLRHEELVTRVRRQARMIQRADSRVQKLKEQIGLKQIVGESEAIRHEIQRVPRFARCDATVLISGESGTGKEVFARAIHYLSARASGPFLPINCGALPEALLESEIFGHQRGAFTGAATDQSGLIGEAQGGTLFLDEVDALTPPAQVKLLRFLQDREYRAVGSQRILYADVRIVAAANVDLRQLLKEGKFREDLFYRLSVLELALPALRERRGDILLLARHFLDERLLCAQQTPKNLSLAAVNCLLSHSWPGNVRELQNVLTRAVVLSDGDVIEPMHLALPTENACGTAYSFQTMKSRVVWRFEHDFLETVMRAHSGNITRAANAVKKNRRAFWELLRKHDLLGSVQDH